MSFPRHQKGSQPDVRLRRIRDGLFRFEEGIVSHELVMNLRGVGGYELSGPDVKASLRSGNEHYAEGGFLDGPTLAVIVTSSYSKPDSLVTSRSGRILVGGESLRWNPVAGRNTVEVCREGQAPFLVASDPWRDSDQGCEWIYHWQGTESDRFVRFAGLLGPFFGKHCVYALYPNGVHPLGF